MAPHVPAGIKAMCFDFDGTLLDTRELIFASMEHVFQHYGLPAKDREILRRFIGLPMSDTYAALTGRDDVSDYMITHREFEMEHIHLARPYAHVIPTLHALRGSGIGTAVVTNRTKKSLMEHLSRMNMVSLFDIIIPREAVSQAKPHPEAIEKALAFFGIPKTHGAMVGDQSPDILAGKNAGVMTIGVTYGFDGENIRDERPDHVIHDIHDVLSIVGGL